MCAPSQALPRFLCLIPTHQMLATRGSENVRNAFPEACLHNAGRSGSRGDLELHTDAATLYRIGNTVGAAYFIEIAEAAEREWMRRAEVEGSAQS